MSATKDGGAAFPQFDVVSGESDGHGDAIEVYTVVSGGMKLRDYFAAAALTAYASNPESSNHSYEEIAQWSYDAADAMIRARAAAARGE
jgi:hypothetical protein